MELTGFYVENIQMNGPSQCNRHFLLNWFLLDNEQTLPTKISPI